MASHCDAIAAAQSSAAGLSDSKSIYTGTPDIGPRLRLFSTDFTPASVFAALSAMAACSVLSTTPQSRTFPSLTVTFDQNRIEFVFVRRI